MCVCTCVCEFAYFTERNTGRVNKKKMKKIEGIIF